LLVVGAVLEMVLAGALVVALLARMEAEQITELAVRRALEVLGVMLKVAQLTALRCRGVLLVLLEIPVAVAVVVVAIGAVALVGMAIPQQVTLGVVAVLVTITRLQLQVQH
jgi:hypothetical protein